MYYTTKRAIRLSWRQGLLFAVHDEVNVLFAVLLQVADQLVEVPVKGEALHHRDIEHVGQAGVPNGENLFSDGLSHRNPPPSCSGRCRR